MRNPLATGLILLTLSAPAAADYPPCDKTPSASDVDAAKGMHKAAEQYYARARYDKAIDSWQEAYGFDCTAHRLLINIGNAHEKLGNTAEAIDAFETYIDRMGSSADPTIVEKVKNLRDLASTQPDPNPQPDPVPQPPPPTPVPQPNGGDTGPGAAPWVVVGAGGAVAIVGGIVMGIGIQKEAAAADECPERGDGGGCPQEVADDGNLGIRMQIGGGVTLGIGLAAAAGGLLWWALTMPSDGDTATTSLDLGPMTVTPSVGLTPSYQGLGLSGTF